MQDLISDEYREQNRLMHEKPHYGVAGKAYAPIIDRISVDFDCRSFLDYGCGKRTMSVFLPHLHFEGYDPAVPEYADLPVPADLVICLDVMEHIEPDRLVSVLDHVRGITKKVALVSVSTRKAYKTLPDGRNAHLIVEPPEWWLPKFLERWKLFTFQRGEDYFYMILEA